MPIVLGGLPGTGKTTLPRRLARHVGAVRVRVDTIEQVLREVGTTALGPEGYVVAYRIAEDKLRVGRSVIADAVNPLQVTRTAWRDVALRVGVPFVEIEVVCSNLAEHRRRVEARRADIDGHMLPIWDDVVSRDFEPRDSDPFVIDTPGRTLEQSTLVLQRFLADVA